MATIPGYRSRQDRSSGPGLRMKVDPNAGYGMMHAGQLSVLLEGLDKFEADPERCAVRKHLRNRSRSKVYV